MQNHLPKIPRRYLVGLALAAGLVAFHAPLLRGLARPLIADDQPGTVDYFCVRGNEYGPSGYRCFEEAADRWRKHTSSRVLVIAAAPSRAVQVGVLPSFEDLTRRELLKQGVPREAIEIVPGAARDCWEETESLGSWLCQHPSGDVALLTNRFDSGRARRIADRLLGDEAARVKILALTDRDFDETDWWRSRSGLKAVLLGWISMAYSVGHGPGDRPKPWTAAEYRRMAEELVGEAEP